MTAKKAPVGPVDISALLEDIRSGKVAPRTSSVTICVHPDVAEKADAVLDKINALANEVEKVETGERGVADPSPTDKLAELKALEDEHDALLAEYESSKVTFTFRSQQINDRAEVAKAIEALEAEDPGDEVGSLVGTAQYSVSPKLTVQDVRDLIPVIGWQQYNALVSCWQILVFGRPTAPKSVRPSRGPVTAKL